MTRQTGPATRRGDRGLTPSSLRQANERTLVRLLARLRSASRAELAKAAGLSQPTAGKIIRRLLRQGALRETGVAQRGAAAEPPSGKPSRRLRPGRPGRPGRLLGFDGRTPRFLALQLDVTETAAALLPFDPHCEEDWSIRFPTTNALDGWLRELGHHRRLVQRKALWGIMVSTPGIVDEPGGKVLFSPNLHWTERTSLIDAVRRLWRLPVVVVQEIRALALGHLMHHPEHRDFLLVDFGEGLGGAIVIDGQPFNNPLPLHGEFGHTPIPGNPRRCGCGGIGCLETLLSRRGLLESFAASGRAGRPDWEAFVRHVGRDGIPLWLDGALAAAGSVIAGALNTLGVRCVVVTGLLNELPPGVLARLFAAIHQGALWARFGELECVPAPRHRAAGLVAAGIDLLTALPASDLPR